MITKEYITELINEKLKGTDFFLVEVKVLPGNKIEVFIDGDKGVAISDCVELSRYIEKSLDKDALDFSLDVSSPGATAPLRLSRQYHKHIGRDIEISLNNGKTHAGKLLQINEGNQIVIETVKRENKPIGKGKITVSKTESFSLSNIKESKVKLKF